MRDLPRGWKQSEVAALADVAIGGTPSRDIPRYWSNNDLDGQPWVAISDLHGRVIECTSESITEAGITNSNVKLVKRGTVLMSFKLSLGRVAFAGCDLYTNEAIAAFLVNDQVAAAYLYYALPEAVRTAATDVAIKGATLNKKSLRKLVIEHPVRIVQEKIATILSTIDTAIEQTEALIEKYQHIKAGLMHDLFTRGVLPTGQLRPPREQAPELYQETAIGWIPREWDAKTLRTSCDWYSGGTPSKRNEEWWKGSFPWLSPKDMKRFELIDTEDHVTHQAALVGSRIAPKGSVFIVVRGMILAHSFPVVINGTEFAFNQDVKAVIGRLPLMNRFLAYWFVANTDLFLKKTTESTHGTKRFDLSDLYKIEIGVPSEDEQQRVIDRLNSVEKQIWAERDLCNKLQTQKRGLMQDLLTGKVAVQVNALAPEAMA